MGPACVPASPSSQGATSFASTSHRWSVAPMVADRSRRTGTTDGIREASTGCSRRALAGDVPRPSRGLAQRRVLRQQGGRRTRGDARSAEGRGRGLAAPRERVAASARLARPATGSPRARGRAHDFRRVRVDHREPHPTGPRTPAPSGGHARGDQRIPRRPRSGTPQRRRTGSSVHAPHRSQRRGCAEDT